MTRRDCKYKLTHNKYIAIKGLITKPSSCGRCFFCTGAKNAPTAYCLLLDTVNYGNAGSVIAETNDMIIDDTDTVKAECPLVIVLGNELKN